MFRDKVRVKFFAGKGGDGKVSFYMGKKPFGGIGGDGGDVYLEGAINHYDLSFIAQDSKFKAEDGIGGGINNLKGAKGEDLILRVPLITKVFDDRGNLLLKVDKIGEKKLLLEGGRGGLGNYYFRTTGVGNLNKALPGTPGQELDAVLELELFSDVIFIGYPNAGKSSILNSITNADSKVAAYAFTTLIPHLGRLGEITLMDLPGLIEGASEGKGLGTRFVKHTKYARVLAHFVSLEDDVEARYLEMRKELKKISEDLDEKKEVVILTKSDLVKPDELKEKVKIMKKHNKDLFVCSVYDYDSLEELKKFLTNSLK